MCKNVKKLAQQALPFATSNDPIRADEFFKENPTRPLSDVLSPTSLSYFDTRKVDKKIYEKTIQEFTAWLANGDDTKAPPRAGENF